MFEEVLTSKIYVIVATWFIVIVGMILINSVANAGSQMPISNEAKDNLDKTRNAGNEGLQHLASDEILLFDLVLPGVGAAVTYGTVKS